MNKKKMISGLMSMALAFSTLGGLTANATGDAAPVGKDWRYNLFAEKVKVYDDCVTVWYKKGVKPYTVKSFNRGDINMDGNVNVTDLNILSAHVKGIRSLNTCVDDEPYYIADINADGERNVTDVNKLAAYIKGIRGFGAPEYRILLNWSDKISLDDLVAT